MTLSKDEIKKVYSSDVSFFDKIKTVLASPSRFYNSVKAETGFKAPMVYLLVMSAVSVVLSMVYSYTGLPGSTASSVSGVLAGIPLAWISGIVATFIIAAVFHIFVYLLGGKNGFLQTFKSDVYGSTPTYLLGWIPYVNIAVGIYALFYLIPKGISIQHNMSMGRAILAILLPVVIIVLVIFLLAAALLMTLFSSIV